MAMLMYGSGARLLIQGDGFANQFDFEVDRLPVYNPVGGGSGACYIGGPVLGDIGGLSAVQVLTVGGTLATAYPATGSFSGKRVTFTFATPVPAGMSVVASAEIYYLSGVAPV